MLSLDLFNSRYEKKLHEGALDDPITRTQAHLMEPLNQRAADIRTQIRNGKLSGADLDKLEKEYEDLVQQRQDIIFDRKTKTQEQQVPSRQDPFAYVKPEPKGIGDVQDPQQKMAQLAQKSKKGPLANVGAGLKAFIKGEPEPMDEEQQAINPRALGVANFQRLVKANMGNIPTVSLEFIRPEENFKLDQKGLDLISDYYDGLESDQAKNYFIYRVLPSGDETTKVLKQLGWSPQIQQSLPGIPTQGELPLQEKKKSNNDDLEAGDVKVARELQKLRARYPAVRSDIEAVASAEIDSTERSQQQLAAIRGANEKQDALLKQLVALDKEQGREIDGLDQENNSLEKRLAQVQATNDRLQQAIGQMTGTKKAAAKTKTTAPQGSADIARGGIIDVGAPATPTSNTTTVTPTSNTTSATNNKAMKYTSQQIQGLGQAAPNIRGKDPANDGGQQVKKVSGSDVNIEEHGGGIGPRKHWQDLMQETVTDIKSGMAEIYRRLAPKIERHRDSFLAGQLYDELENYAELHGAEKEFKQMMNGARNRAHMEYDTNPGGFHNWFWFLPFADDTMTENTDDVKKRMSKLEALALAANRAGDDAKCKMYQQKIQSLKQKLSQSMNEFDASGYDRYSIYMDDYDLKEKFSDLDDAVEAIEAYKRDDPKSRYADYNVRDLDGKVVWRNDAWQDIQKPGKIQFLPRNDQGVAEATGDSKFDAMMGRISQDPWTQLNSDPNWEYEIEELVDQHIEPWLLAMERSGMPITRDNETLNPGWRKRYEQVSTQLAQKYLASKKFNPRDPDLVGKIRAAIDNHTDQSRNVHGQLSAYANDLPMQRYADAFDADGQTANIRDTMAGLRPGDEDDDDGYAPRPRPDADPRRLDPGNIEESSKPGEYYVHTVYFKDGTKKRIRVTSDEFDVADYYTKRGQAVDRVDYDFQLHSDMTEAEKEPTTRQELLDRVDKIQRMMSQERNPANLQILRKKLEMIKQRYQHLREDSDSGEAVEMAIMRRMLVAHTDLIIEFGLDKVVNAIEEVAYNVGDTDEIGSSDVSGWVRQVKQILGVDA